MIEFLEMLVAIGEAWYLRRFLAFVVACGFGFYACGLAFGHPGAGGNTPNLLSALGYSLTAAFFLFLTFRRRKDSSR